MKIFLFLFMVMLSIYDYASASQCIQTPYATNGQVTAVNLNAGLQEPCTIVNGNLDNTNANTSAGYRFYQTVGALPSAGNTGQVYYLTTDNSLNFDTGSTFIKTIGIAGSPAQGDVVYYGATGLNYLAPGTAGFPLLTGGSAANPSFGELTTAATVSGAALTSLSSVPSGAGSIPVANVGNILGAWASKSAATPYLAATDGFFVASCQEGTGGQSCQIMTDASNPPTTVRSQCSPGTNNTFHCSVFSPARKGDYYEVTVGSGSLDSAYFISIGS